MVAERRANPRELDFVSAMVQSQAESGVINDAELISNVFVITAAQGTTATVTGTAANYDPTVYPEPTKFDIHRNPRNILTFGTGVHHCSEIDSHVGC